MSGGVQVDELQRELRATGLTGPVLRGLHAAAVARLDGADRPEPGWLPELTARLVGDGEGAAIPATPLAGSRN